MGTSRNNAVIAAVTQPSVAESLSFWYNGSTASTWTRETVQSTPFVGYGPPTIASTDYPAGTTPNEIAIVDPFLINGTWGNAAFTQAIGTSPWTRQVIANPLSKNSSYAIPVSLTSSWKRATSF